jgi:hypothetical protein
MNVIDWMRESAVFMAADRPDIYDTNGAMGELDRLMNNLRDRQESIVLFSSYALVRFAPDDGEEEFMLLKKISSVNTYEDGMGEVLLLSHTQGTNSLKTHVNLPSVIDDPEFEDEE